MQIMRDRGIKIISITEPAFNMEGEFSELLQYIIAYFNNWYLTNLKQNIKTGLERARAQGKQIGAAPVSFNERRAYHLLFIEKVSQRKVAEELGVSAATINRFRKVCVDNPPSFINTE